MAASSFRQRLLLRLLSIYPPYLGAGIRAKMLGDMDEVEVVMKLHWWNRNYVGTHFGGSLYSMADPFFMLILMRRLGPDYVVWDKAATIRFRRPGRGTVRARFRIEPEEVERIRQLANSSEKVEPVFRTVVLDENGETVAEIEKILHVRRKST